MQSVPGSRGGTDAPLARPRYCSSPPRRALRPPTPCVNGDAPIGHIGDTLRVGHRHRRRRHHQLASYRSIHRRVCIPASGQKASPANSVCGDWGPHGQVLNSFILASPGAGLPTRHKPRPCDASMARRRVGQRATGLDRSRRECTGTPTATGERLICWTKTVAPHAVELLTCASRSPRPTDADELAAVAARTFRWRATSGAPGTHRVVRRRQSSARFASIGPIRGAPSSPPLRGGPGIGTPCFRRGGDRDRLAKLYAPGYLAPGTLRH